MKKNVKYALIDKDIERDFTRLRCIINNKEKVIFEFSYEALSQLIHPKLRLNSSADDLYQAIEIFLCRELDNNNLKNIYSITTNNYYLYCL